MTARKSPARTRSLGYGGLFLLLLAVVLSGAGATESRYESGTARFQGRVVSKNIHGSLRSRIMGVTYRVTIEGREIEREGDVGTRERWDALRTGDPVEVQAVGTTPNETRLPVERVAGSGVYFALAAAAAAGGMALLVLRFRRR
jgi:hypothetical protein